MTDDSSAYHEKLQEMLETQSRIKDLNEARQAMHDMMVNQSSDPLSLEEREAMLNVDQRRIYDNLLSHLQQNVTKLVNASVILNRFPCLSVEWVVRENPS